MKKTTKNINKTNKQLVKKKVAKKRVMAAPRVQTPIKKTAQVSRFEKIEDTDSVTIRVAQPQRVNARLTYMPRSTKDRRVREWTSEETMIAKEWYARGLSRAKIAKLLDVSHSPLNKMLYKQGVLKPAHVIAAYKAGYLNNM